MLLASAWCAVRYDMGVGSAGNVGGSLRTAPLPLPQGSEGATTSPAGEKLPEIEGRMMMYHACWALGGPPSSSPWPLEPASPLPEALSLQEPEEVQALAV